MTPRVLMVMGVAGSGKSTVGEALAARLGWPYRDADDFHSAANRAKMAAGHPLTDEDRWPWLDAIAAWIDEHRRAGTHGVVTCSALKRVYRDRIVGGRADVRIVYLRGAPALIADRMGHREGHFMPTSLLKSQLDTLEPPADDEHPVTVSIDQTPTAMVEQVLAETGLDAAVADAQGQPAGPPQARDVAAGNPPAGGFVAGAVAAQRNQIA